MYTLYTLPTWQQPVCCTQACIASDCCLVSEQTSALQQAQKRVSYSCYGMQQSRTFALRDPYNSMWTERRSRPMQLGESFKSHKHTPLPQVSQTTATGSGATMRCRCRTMLLPYDDPAINASTCGASGRPHRLKTCSNTGRLHGPRARSTRLKPPVPAVLQPEIQVHVNTIKAHPS